MSQSFNANYTGKQAPPSAYVKNFYDGSSNGLWKITQNPTQSIESISDVYDVRISKDLYVGKDLYVTGSIYNHSDKRVKQDIKPIYNESYNNIMNLSPKKYIFRDDYNKKEHYGFIAQDMEKVFPQLVTSDTEGIGNYGGGVKSINYIELIPFLVAKIQDLQKEVDTLKKIFVPTSDDSGNNK